MRNNLTKLRRQDITHGTHPYLLIKTIAIIENMYKNYDIAEIENDDEYSLVRVVDLYGQNEEYVLILQKTPFGYFDTSELFNLAKRSKKKRIKTVVITQMGLTKKDSIVKTAKKLGVQIFETKTAYTNEITKVC